MPTRRTILAATLGATVAAVPELPASAATAVKVYVAGDSTASTYVTGYEPRTGWGQALQLFLTPDATVVNDKARAEGAKPVLVTPVERRRFSSAGVATTSHGAYPGAMRQLAAAKGVPLVDLSASSLALWNSLGVPTAVFKQLTTVNIPDSKIVWPTTAPY